MNLLSQHIWNQVRDGFAQRHGNALRDLWFKHTRPLNFSRGLFVLGVPNLFVREWLEKKYVKDIEELFQEITGSPVKVLIKIDGYMYRLMNEISQGAPKRTEGRGSQAGAPEEKSPPFVTRPENKIAGSAFDKVLRDAPASTFNPLFLYGPAGTGKTHLIRQFVGKAKRTSYFSAVDVIDALKFASGFNAAARVGNRVRFRGGVLRSDLLVIEEVHRLKGKIKTQLELLSILKYLVERQRQVVITSRHHPRDIDLFEDSLASFLLSGMMISILGYSFEGMVEILSKKISDKKASAPPTLVEAVARVKSIGIDKRVKLIERTVSLAELKGETATAAFFKEHFPDYDAGIISEDRVDQIIDLVARRRGVERSQITSNSKVRKVVEARYLVIYLATTLLKTSSRRISRWLGNISPSIVPYARRRIDERRQKESEFSAVILDLQAEIEGGQRYLF